jgi:hypothetical protein
LYDGVRCKVYQWTITTTNQDGAPVIIRGKYADKSIQAFGTWGTTPTLKFQGTNEVVTPANWYNLNDPQGSEISLAADKIEQVLENTYQVRPYLPAGTGTTLTVILCVKG